jgi:hypothetical protein
VEAAEEEGEEASRAALRVARRGGGRETSVGLSRPDFFVDWDELEEGERKSRALK